MKLADVEQLAGYAMQMGYYANAIELSRELFDVLPNYEIRHEEEVDLPKRSEQLRSYLVKLNNAHLEKYKSVMEKERRMMPYLVDKKLGKKKKQPDYIKNGQVNIFNIDNDKMKEEWLFVHTCRNGKWYPKSYHGNRNLLCRFLHHGDPYLKLGPFKEDHTSTRPYAVVFRDILSDDDIDNLVESSRPNLSRKRTFDNTGGAQNVHDINSGKYRRIVHKTVQAWLQDVAWPSIFEDGYFGKNHLGMVNPGLWKLAKRISLATQLVTDTQTGGTLMQVTNYGLGGLCEQHVDPHGLMESDEDYYRKEKPELYIHGDMIATFMAWLSDTDEGGATAYLNPGLEGLLMPDRGSAAFWYDLKSDGYRDVVTKHAGCPVLKGSKWILNKWLYWYDNYRKFPCHPEKSKPFDPPSKTHYFSN